jgi:drug/metabolite transporter (DMT)-like permease
MGDILAVWMTLMMALAFVVFRIWPDSSPASATLLSTIVVILIAGTCDIPQIQAAEEIPSLFLYGGAFAVMSITMGEAALRLPAITVGLLSLIEVPLAPIFAFLLITEIPSFVSVAVGTVVLLSVIYAQSGKQDF